MTRMMRTSATVLTLALVAGCGTKALVPPAQAPLGEIASQSTTREAQVRALIARAQALHGNASAVLAERVHIYNQLAHTDSDTAADFLLADLARWETWPEATQNTLEPPLLAALKQLAADDKMSMEAVPTEAQATAIDTAEAGKKGKHGRRFNIWDGIYKFFGVKRRHHKGGGGSGPGPAPAPHDAPPATDPGGDSGGAPGGAPGGDPAGPPAPPAG